jgi:hypothetical protein
MASATAVGQHVDSRPTYAADDPFAALDEPERSSTLAEDDAPAWVTAAPPPSPPRAATAAPLPPISLRPRRLVKPIRKPRLPVAFLDLDKRLHRWVAMIGLVVYAVAGIGVIIFGYQRSADDRRFNQVAQHAEGRLFGDAVRNDLRGTGRRRSALRYEAYDVKYYFNFNGHQYTGKATQLQPADLPKGADVTRPFDNQNLVVDVRFDPNHPEDNRLTAGQIWVDWLIMAVGAGLLFSGIGGFWAVFRYDRYARATAA